MINYDKPDDDPIVAEVRKAREEILPSIIMTWTRA